eukprot:398046-Amphidinium_carterae.2
MSMFGKDVLVTDVKQCLETRPPPSLRAVKGSKNLCHRASMDTESEFYCVLCRQGVPPAESAHQNEVDLS